jgi:hypothetical protein
MFNVKDILFIPNYKFENGNVDNKILIILWKDADTIITYTFTTSQTKYIPDIYLSQIGCILDGASYSMYSFAKKMVIGLKPDGSDFAFDEPTFIIFTSNSLGDVDLNNLLDEYPNLYLLGTFDDAEFNRLMNCLKSSGTIARRYKRLFNR